MSLGMIQSDRQGAGQVRQFSPEEINLLNDLAVATSAQEEARLIDLATQAANRNPKFREAVETIAAAKEHPDDHHIVMELGRSALVLVAGNGQPLDEEELMPKLRYLMKGYSQLLVTRRRVPLSGIKAAVKLNRGRINDAATPMVAAVVNPVLEDHGASPHSIELQSNTIGEVLTHLYIQGVGSIYIATN